MEISFILVEPTTPENVGAAARAIYTMGFNRLLLVNPCDHLSNPARWLAHGSTEILENAPVYPTLNQAIEGIDFVIGTSAKNRSVKQDYQHPGQLPELLCAKGSTVRRAAVVFGREDSGLRNEELAVCDVVTSIPMKTSFPSLNLAQAVMLYAWELSKTDRFLLSDRMPANKYSFRFLTDKVAGALRLAGFNEGSQIFTRYLKANLLHSYCSKVLGKK